MVYRRVLDLNHTYAVYIIVNPFIFFMLFLLHCAKAYAKSCIMKRLTSRWIPYLLVWCLAACGSAPHKTNSVWDNYDIRHAAPMPNTYGGYVDNDVYYRAPDCSIMDAPSCGGD